MSKVGIGFERKEELEEYRPTEVEVGIALHVSSGVQANKEKPLGTAKFAMESLFPLQEALFPETNSNCCLLATSKDHTSLGFTEE